MRAMSVLLVLLVTLALALAVACGDEDRSLYNPPADHTVSQDGARHKPGFQSPLTNCTSCHGADLKGGTVKVSCYTCHGQKW